MTPTSHLPFIALWTVAALALSGCERPAKRAWEWAGNGPGRSGLLAVEGGVIAANEAGTVARLTSDGEAVWVAQLGREVASRPAVVGDQVVAATVGGEWVGLHFATGAEQWRLGGKPTLTLPLASDGVRAFAVSGDGAVTALSGRNGGTAWKRLPPRGAKGMQLTAPPLVHDGRLFVALGAAGLYALNPKDGDTLWHRKGDVLGFLAEGARLYALGRDGTMRALAAADGGTHWEKALETEVQAGPTLARGLLWVGAKGNQLLAVDPQDGSVTWRTTLPAPLRGGVGAYRELVLVPTSGSEGHLLGLRPGQEKPVLDLEVHSPLRQTPQVVDEKVILQASDGRVLAWEILKTSR